MALTTASYSQTWVSNTGTDAGACAITAPCKTFAYAVTQTPTWGQLSVLNAGDYGPVTITKPMRLDGGGFATNVINSSQGNGITVNTSGGVVQLHNLSLHSNFGGGTGIHFTGFGGLDIDNVQLTGFWIGIYALSGSSVQNITIKDTTIENISDAGINIQGASSANLDAAVVINTHVRYANYGLIAQNATVSILNSTFTSPIAGPPPGTFYSDGIVSYDTNLYMDNCQINGYLEGIYANGGITQVNRSSLLNNKYAVVASPNVLSNGSNTSFDNSMLLADYGAPAAATMW
jgi:hypothetical protein